MTDKKTHVWINPERLDKFSTTEKCDGIELVVRLSPYDVPRAVSGEYVQPDGLFVIEFQYLGEEPAMRMPGSSDGGGIHLWQGRHSGKLMKIAIPIDKPPLDSAAIIRLRTTITGAIDGLPGDNDQSGMNRRATRRILEEDFAALSGQLVGAGCD